MNFRPIRPGSVPPKHPYTSFPDDLPRLTQRRPDSHKGDFGHCLVVGGSFGMAGAAALSGLAALRTGSGLVRIAVPRCCVSTVASYEPSYMTAPLPEDSSGRISLAAADHIFALARSATHIVVGPGLARLDVLTTGRAGDRACDERQTERDNPHGWVIALGHGDASLLRPGARRANEAA